MVTHSNEENKKRPEYILGFADASVFENPCQSNDFYIEGFEDGQQAIRETYATCLAYQESLTEDSPEGVFDRVHHR